MPQRAFFQREITTAYHEAAHAVVAYRLGVRIAYAHVVSGSYAHLRKRGVTTLGMCALARADLHKLSDDDAHFLKLAPGPAESRRRVERGMKPLVVDYPSDLGDVVEFLLDNGSDHTAERLSESSYARLDAAHTRARAFVADDANWRAIQAVAALLLEACIIQGKAGVGNAAIVAAIETSR